MHKMSSAPQKLAARCTVQQFYRSALVYLLINVVVKCLEPQLISERFPWTTCELRRSISQTLTAERQRLAHNAS